MSGRAIRATVRGRVQGVFFRDTTQRRARELGVSGWVRNEDDGSVRVHAEGQDEAVAALEAFLAEGPPGARVDDLAVEPAKVEGHEQFGVRGVPHGRFAVTERDGRFALVLEVGGAPRTWTLAKAPSTVPAQKRMAFEAKAAPEGGAPWDGGPYEQGGRVAWPEALDRGHAVFVLHGERLKGGWALQRTKPGAWLLVKRRDEHATEG